MDDAFSTKRPESRRRFIWRVGYARFGLPLAIALALYTFGKDYGLAFHYLLSVRFLAYLVCWLLGGAVGGYLFGSGMWKAFRPRE